MENNVLNRRIAYYETDRMGIVHHSNHIRYFEEARLNYMRNIGCDVKELEDEGVFIPNVDAYAKYKKPLRFGDVVNISVKLVEFTGAKMKYEYEICVEGSDEVTTVGSTTHCFADGNLKPLSIKKRFPKQYNILLENLAK